MRLFDLHCDTLTECEKRGCSVYRNDRMLDLERGTTLYEQWAQVMAIFVPDTLRGEAAWEYTRRVVAFSDREFAKHADFCQLVFTPDDLTAALASGRCAVLRSLENGAALGDDLTRIETLSRQGFVLCNLTWNGANALGNGCMAADVSGLTPLGRQAVQHLYAQGMLPDVSHLNRRGFWDVCALADGRPFVASHSVSDAVFAHPRSLTDEQFCAARDSGGLVGLNLCKAQLGEQSFEMLFHHLMHFLSLGGEKTLALGLDLDGTALPPEWGGIAAAAKCYRFLEQKGMERSLLEDIFFENARSFFVKCLTYRKECIKI